MQMTPCEAQATPFSQTGNLCRWKPFGTANTTNTETDGVCEYEPEQLSFVVSLLLSLPHPSAIALRL
jgi:hypothetical protein